MDLQAIYQNLPPDFWFKTTIFAIIVAVIVLAVRIYIKSNKILLSIVIFAVVEGIFSTGSTTGPNPSG